MGKEENKDLADKPAPLFTLPSSEIKPISLKDFLGKTVVLFFYPKDESRACTIEVLAFKDKYWELADKDAVVLGISADKPKDHQKFIRHYDLPFPLLSDVDHSVAEIYGVWVQKLMYGKTYWGIERTVFIIDKKGIIKEILKRLKPEEYAEFALKAVNDLTK